MAFNQKINLTIKDSYTPISLPDCYTKCFFVQYSDISITEFKLLANEQKIEFKKKDPHTEDLIIL